MTRYPRQSLYGHDMYHMPTGVSEGGSGQPCVQHPAAPHAGAARGRAPADRAAPGSLSPGQQPAHVLRHSSADLCPAGLSFMAFNAITGLKRKAILATLCDGHRTGMRCHLHVLHAVRSPHLIFPSCTSWCGAIFWVSLRMLVWQHRLPVWKGICGDAGASLCNASSHDSGSQPCHTNLDDRSWYAQDQSAVLGPPVLSL